MGLRIVGMWKECHTNASASMVQSIVTWESHIEYVEGVKIADNMMADRALCTRVCDQLFTTSHSDFEQ